MAFYSPLCPCSSDCIGSLYCAILHLLEQKNIWFELIWISGKTARLRDNSTTIPNIWNGTMFGDVDWPLKASRGLSATVEFLVHLNVECVFFTSSFLYTVPSKARWALNRSVYSAVSKEASTYTYLALIHGNFSTVCCCLRDVSMHDRQFITLSYQSDADA